jgi:hypothetical protein
LLQSNKSFIYQKSVSKIKVSGALEKMLQEIEFLKAKLDSSAQGNFDEILKKSELEYTF